MLPDRTADTVAAWLKQHPGIAILCRDRAGAYAEAARIGARQAVQVADRWHLWHNLCEAVDKTVSAHRGELRADLHEHADQSPDVIVPDKVPLDRTVLPADPAAVEGALVVRTRERYARAEHVQDLLVKARSRQSLLDAFKPYLRERFNAAHTDAAALTLQITALGYRGSDKTVRYLQPFRASLSAPAPIPVAPQRPAAHRLADPQPGHPERRRTPGTKDDPGP